MSDFSDLSPFSFDDPTPIEVPCTIGGKQYVLQESSEPVANHYLSILSRGVVESGVSPLDNLAAADQYLLSQCLRDRTTGDLVTQDLISGWTKRCKKPLTALLKRISDLDMTKVATADAIEKQIAELQSKLDLVRKGEAEPAKNGLSAGTAGSV